MVQFLNFRQHCMLKLHMCKINKKCLQKNLKLYSYEHLTDYSRTDDLY